MSTSPSQVPESRDSAAPKPAEKSGAWLSENELDALAALDPLAILETTDRVIEEAMSVEFRAPQPISWDAQPNPAAAPTPTPDTPAPAAREPEAPEIQPQTEFQPQQVFQEPTPTQPVDRPEPAARQNPPTPNADALQGDWAVVYLPWRRNAAGPQPTEPPPRPEPEKPSAIAEALAALPELAAAMDAEVPPFETPHPSPEPGREPTAAAERPDSVRMQELADWATHGMPQATPEPASPQRDGHLLVARRMVLPLGLAEHAQVRVEVWSNPSERTPRYRASISIDDLPVRGADSLDEALLSVREWLFDRLSGQQPVWRRRDGR